MLWAIQDGLLDENIPLYLLLNIVNGYASVCINSMHYNRETMDIWVTFSNLFKGRGIYFMRGYKGVGPLLKEIICMISTSQCGINSAVPFDTTHRKKLL